MTTPFRLISEKANVDDLNDSNKKKDLQNENKISFIDYNLSDTTQNNSLLNSIIKPTKKESISTISNIFDNNNNEEYKSNSLINSVQAIPSTTTSVNPVVAIPIEEPLIADNVSEVSHKSATSYVNKNNYQTLKEAQDAYKNLGGTIITKDKNNKSVIALNNAIDKIILRNKYLKEIETNKQAVSEENRKAFNDFIQANSNITTPIKNRNKFKNNLQKLVF